MNYFNSNYYVYYFYNNNFIYDFIFNEFNFIYLILSSEVSFHCISFYLFTLCFRLTSYYIFLLFIA